MTGTIGHATDVRPDEVADRTTIALLRDLGEPMPASPIGRTDALERLARARGYGLVAHGHPTSLTLRDGAGRAVATLDDVSLQLDVDPS